MGGLTVFFSFFGRSRFFILFLDPSPLRTFVVLVPVAAHLVPIIRNLDAVVYIRIYTLFFFFCQFISLSPSRSRSVSLDPDLSVSLLSSTMMVISKIYIYTYNIRSFSFAGRVSFVRARIRVYIHTHNI